MRVLQLAEDISTELDDIFQFFYMYDHCAQEMVSAGVAFKLDEPVLMTKNGVIVDSSENAFGCKVTHRIVRLDMCLCGDEVGGNICMAGRRWERWRIIVPDRKRNDSTE